MKRKSQYREVGEILHNFLPCLVEASLRHCLSVPLLRWDVLRRWKNMEQREIRCSGLPDESNPECEQCPALQAELLASPSPHLARWLG